MFGGRGTGIVNNQLYIGRLVWNRQHFMKNPETSKRVTPVVTGSIDLSGRFATMAVFVAAGGGMACLTMVN